MIAAREVMLPFILAVVIAYVLTPLVASLERRKMSRGLAVVCVYAIVLGSFGGLHVGDRPADRARVQEPPARAPEAVRPGARTGGSPPSPTA